MKTYKLTLVFTTLFLLIKFQLKAQEGYTYTLINNGENSYTIGATPSLNLANTETSLQSYGFTIILPQGAKASISSSIGNGASATFFDGSNIGHSAIDGYLISEKLENTILLPATSKKGIIDVVTIQIHGAKTSEAIYLLDNNSKLANAVTALKSFITADIVDNSISQFTNILSSNNSETSRKSSYVPSVSSEKDKLTSLSIYPNPTEDDLFIELLDEKQEIIAIELFNTHGHRVWKDEGNLTTINISNLKMGIYFIKILTSDNTYITKKIIKQ